VRQAQEEGRHLAVLFPVSRFSRDSVQGVRVDLQGRGLRYVRANVVRCTRPASSLAFRGARWASGRERHLREHLLVQELVLERLQGDPVSGMFRGA